MVSSSERTIETDITVFGATGFVGKHVCAYLLASAASDPRPFRLTLAGRSRDKLEARKQTFNAGTTKVDVFVADCDDAAALVQMAKRSRVVLNCAGPFQKYATNVVAACAQTGSDYVDITGEVHWAARMRSQYGAAARESGARIISLCGFDSVPSDLSVYAAVHTLREATGAETEIESGQTWHAALGSMNGGTLHTALDIPIDISRCIMKEEGGKQHVRKIPYFLEDPLVLAHPTKARFDPKYDEWKDKMSMTEWWNQFPSFDSIVNGGMSIPFLMASVNAKVVQASAATLKYGPNFSYRERFYPMGFRWTRLVGPLSMVPALMFQAALFAAVAVLKLPIIGRKLADWILPPGSGPPDALLESCHAQVYAEVISRPDASGLVDRATCFIDFRGDPGNLLTAQCVSESALALVYDRSELPSRSDDGFGTPAELLCPVLLRRLKENKVRKVKVVTHVVKQVPKYGKQIYM